MLSKVSRPMTMTLKKDLKKKIVELCKKQKTCPHCGTVQPTVKRIGYYRIVMEILRPPSTQRKLLPYLTHMAEVTATDSCGGDFLRIDLGTAKVRLISRMEPRQTVPQTSSTRSFS